MFEQSWTFFSSRVNAHSMCFSPASSSSPNITRFGSDASVDSVGFLTDYYRAGGPQLCSLPAYEEVIGPEYSCPAYEDPEFCFIMGDTVQQILRDVEITDSLHRVSFRGRPSEYKSEPTAIPTILVVFRHQKGSRELSSKWCQAAKMICSKLQPWLPGLSVELIDERLLMHPRCSPVPSSHPILSKWSQICDEIIKSSDMTTWSGISCWQYGAESQWCENPVTLVVKLMENASGPFVTSAQRIRSILARYEIQDVDVLFMKNGPSSQYSGQDADLSKDACSRYALPGVSIGVKGSRAGPATFGGFVELKLPGDLEWHCFGLTCFHCILEPSSTSPIPPVSREKAALEYWQNHPVEPDDQEAANLFRIEHPASSDVASKIKELQTQIDDDPEDERLCEGVRSGVPMTPWELRKYELHRQWTTAITEEEDFFKDVFGSNLLLGHVFAGSGLNRFIPLPANEHTTEGNSGLPKNCRFLDWALIDVLPSRIPSLEENKPHVYGTLLRPKQMFGYPCNPSSIVRRVWKSGRSSHLTEGRLNPIEDFCISNRRTAAGAWESVPTYEHTAIGLSENKRFSRQGDHGSFVFNGSHDVVGMITGAMENKSYTAFTPMHEIFEDIKRVTGAEDVRIATAFD